MDILPLFVRFLPDGIPAGMGFLHTVTKGFACLTDQLFCRLLFLRLFCLGLLLRLLFLLLCHWFFLLLRFLVMFLRVQLVGDCPCFLFRQCLPAFLLCRIQLVDDFLRLVFVLKPRARFFAVSTIVGNIRVLPALRLIYHQTRSRIDRVA